jgi:S-DNA-T family DNA segregation ATPase FtsK/SpoIIIE
MGQKIMNQPLLSERLRTAIRAISKAAGERAAAETQMESRYQDRKSAAETEFRLAEQRIQQDYDTLQSLAIGRFQEKSKEISTKFDDEHDAKSRQYSARQFKVREEFKSVKETLDGELEETRWAIDTVLEADKKVAKDELVLTQRLVGTTVQKIDSKHKEIINLIKKWQRAPWMSLVEVTPADKEKYPDALEGLKGCLTTNETCFEKMLTLTAPRLLKGYRLPILFALLWLVSLVPAWWMLEWYYWIPATLAGVASIGLVVHYLLFVTFRHQFLTLYRRAKQALVDSEGLQNRCLEDASVHYTDQIQKAREKFDAALSKAQMKYESKQQAASNRRDSQLEELKNRYEPILEDLQNQRADGLRKAEDKYQKRMAASNQQYETQMEEAVQQKKQKLEEARQSYEAKLHDIWEDWQLNVNRLTTVTRQVNEKCDTLFPDWAQFQEPCWELPAKVPLGLTFGDLEISLDRIPQGIPQHERLIPLVPAPITVAALLPFPHNGSLLLKVRGDGRSKAIQLLQAVMLRCLTSLPPGKVRFTIFDPVGLGENFAAFSHLADHDEKLVTSRIWTETEHIEQRLTDLTEHIENVIQKYLRNQFQSLEEYNDFAGEVAEPYRVLVVSHFPVNFSEEAARRLISIANSGSRCGIQTFVMVDENLGLPRNFDLKDLEQCSTVLEWGNGQFVWPDPDFGRFPLMLEQPPAPETCTTIMQYVGASARDANRVEVPFLTVAPPSDQWWSSTSMTGIRVPLGRAGATRRQFLELGQGTSQHVLIAGKTGSGKSTLLHAMIVQLALSYTPDEVELYLVDFKKGVEFKTYATHHLPHARVIAVESEREFGLSVLQRLDAELKLRGDRFRSFGVNDLPSYWETHSEPLPRILLVVDEFQEFFVEDDRVAQESALLLDRLVRQGRAFGIHILLGSQTLGGAYSLARSTIDQMAVRIALQCSETDGHLILSKDNSAARLLSRPGEAIYNNANGLLEGNNLFQIVWLSEHQREELLEKVHTRFNNGQAAPQIVFEGNAPAEISNNPLLHRLLVEPPAAVTGKETTAWLGDAIAIKDPTAAVFRRQSGSNLLLIGQQPETSLGILCGAILSLGARLPEGNDGPRFYLLCDTAADDDSVRLFRRLAEILPHRVQVIGWQELPAAMNELAADVDQRLQSREMDHPLLFLCIHGLQRFRDLRRDDDDFGFSRRGDDKAASPAKQFVHVLREGPTAGVFSLVWCDTMNNLQRMLERQTLKEFDMRILFQMNANDSSNLIDSPVAAKLGLYRALFYAENEGRLEKFRPYNLPDGDWLEWVKGQLSRPPVSTET